MKQLTWKLVLPLTIVSFTMFTKWWYVAVDDYREILRGFPLAFVCRGWHTSMSLQIFLFEFIVDVFVYFLFWFLLILAATRTRKVIRVPRFLTIIMLATSGLCMIILVALASNPDNLYTTRRPFDFKLIETGYRFIWEDETRPMR